MGQQQLLLVILVTIIVGVATVVAINIFGQSAANANYDATRQDVLTMSAMSQAWYIKPDLLGGGGGTFTGMTLDDIGFGHSGITSTDATTGATTYSNANGTYVLAASGDELTITATPLKATTRTITATVGPNTMSIE